MRLTLRTLLAYLDANLPADQARELESKIQQSEAAQQLIARIQEVQGRVRLGAPSIHGRGAGGDPNSVAEYLDNRLRSEKTAEIEKICIESDMQLAEAASCHQILSQALGKPLQSPHELRQRLYGIQDLVINEGQPHPDADFVRPAAATAAPVGAEANGSHGAWYYVLVGALSLSITLVLLAGGTYLLGGFDRAENDVADNDATPVVNPDDVNPPVVDPGEEDADDARAEGDSDSEDDDSTAIVPAEDVPPPGDGDAPGEGPIAPPEAPGEGLAGPASPTTSEEGDGNEPPTLIVEDAGPPAPTTAEEPAPVAAGPVAIGSVADVPEAANLVALFDEQNVDASRVPADGKILTGQSYVTFPLFHSAVYASPFHFRFQGDGHWGFEAPVGEGPMTLQLEQGTARIVADQPVALNVRLNGQVHTIRFDEPATELAVRASIARFPGDDPREVASPHVADYVLLKGKATLASTEPPLTLEAAKPVRWTEGIGVAAVETPPETASSPAATEGLAETGAAPSPALPEWVDQPVMPLEEKAIADILANLPPDRSLKLSLTEIAVADSREEVQAIAVWALCSLQYFEPALDSLNDPEQRSFWRTTLRAMRRDLSLSQSAATTLRTAVDNKYPIEGDTVWSMLLGYSPEQLAAGGDAELVRNLESPDLGIRVLAFLNLFEITDITHTYRPEVVENRRRSAVNRWLQMLKSGGIRYLHPPLPAQPTHDEEEDATPPTEEPAVAEDGASTPAVDEAPAIIEETDVPPPPPAVGDAVEEESPSEAAPGPLVFP